MTTVRAHTYTHTHTDQRPSSVEIGWSWNTEDLEKAVESWKKKRRKTKVFFFFLFYRTHS